ncbi:hypothetical protein C0992_002956, partial [Termitomyces sp. T32_za158]
MFNLALFPADTVKSAMQTQQELRPTSAKDMLLPNVNASFWGTAKEMYAKQGVRG